MSEPWLVVIDPQRISAQSQLSRLKSGLMGPDQLDLAGLMKWGRAGEAVLGELAVLSAEPGREAAFPEREHRVADRIGLSALRGVQLVVGLEFLPQQPLDDDGPGEAVCKPRRVAIQRGLDFRQHLRRARGGVDALHFALHHRIGDVHAIGPRERGFLF